MASRREYELIAKLLCANLSRLEDGVVDAQTAYAIRAARNAVVSVAHGLADTFEGLSATFERERFFIASGLDAKGEDSFATQRISRKRAK